MRFLLAVTGLVVSLSGAHGQFLIGPTAGLQYSWVKFAETENKSDYRIKPVWGYHAGVATSFRSHKRFFLTASILYSVKGKVIEGVSDKFLREEVRYNFIEVPLLYSVDFKARLGRNNEFKYFLGIGPNISYWLGGKGTLYDSDLREQNIPERDFSIAFDKQESEISSNEMAVRDANRVQLGMNLAAGLAFEPLPDRKIIMLLRYEFGHSYFSTEQSGDFRDTSFKDNLRTRNLGARISLYYLFDTKTSERKKGKSTIRTKNH